MTFCLLELFRHRRKISDNCSPYLRTIYGEQISINPSLYLISRKAAHTYGEQISINPSLYLNTRKTAYTYREQISKNPPLYLSIKKSGE